MKRASRAVLGIATALALGAACEPVPGVSLSLAPGNDCPLHPCDAYPPGRAKATCTSRGRCEVAGRPDAFTIVVSVPTTSSFAPGSTFFVSSDDFLNPKTVRPSCPKPSCLTLPALGRAQGGYTVTREAGTLLGFGWDKNTPNIAFPVHATFIPELSDGTPAAQVGLLAPTVFSSSTVNPDDTISYGGPLPAGRYLRMQYPEPPYDQYLPPVAGELVMPNFGSGLGTLTDQFSLGTSALDDATGTTRVATVRRAEGLDGFRIWLSDTASSRRVSVIRSLTGTVSHTRLDTSGQSAPGLTALRDGLSVVVAPPDSWIAVPRFESELIGGQGLANIEYPTLASPAQVNGIVGEPIPASDLVTGIPSRLTFSSTTIVIADGTKQPLVRYDTSVFTDGAGRFATVVPPGVYDVVIEPAEGTGFSKVKQTVEITKTQALRLVPPRRSVAVGRAVLGDGRPLAGATVLAVVASPSSAAVAPRGGRTVTDEEGNFRLEVDLGTYAISVVPAAGTGFPRVVTIRPVNAGPEEQIGDVVVPPPMNLSFTVKDPREGQEPVAHAVVRIFAAAGGGTGGSGASGASASSATLVEIGNAMTDDSGKCEILLADQPR